MPYHPSETARELVKLLPPPPSEFRGYLTGIGSRKTPPEACELLYLLAAVLYSHGYIWRSGGAAGADEAIEQGVLDHPHYKPGSSYGDVTLEVYLPWTAFEPVQGEEAKSENVKKGYLLSSRLPTYHQAQEWATCFHPIGDQLREKRGAFALHTRNVFQVLGQNLQTPSARVYCWAPPTSDELVTGGTRTAVKCAQLNRIPVVNLAKEASYTAIHRFVHRTFEALKEGHPLALKQP